MIPHQREAFNRAFTDAKYRAFADSVAATVGAPIEFRLSETPCFFPAALIAELTDAAHEIVGEILDDRAYLHAAEGIVPERFRVHGGERTPAFIQVDFGLVKVGDCVEGRLVELQAFPSLYGFQLLLAETSLTHWALDNLGVLPAGLTREQYLHLVRTAIVGTQDPAEVVLMELDPASQKTLPDFTATEKLWGVRAIDVREVIREGRHLFYMRDGARTPIKRIYNRVIPDELERAGIDLPFDYRDDLDVEWTGGPDWFFKMSKFSLPWLSHRWVPKSQYLSEVTTPPADRERWLLKPLFSFAGSGIVFAPTDAELAAIPADRRHLYLLQELMTFAPLIETPHGATQAEVRLMMVRDGDGYRTVLPLVRMGRGKMMGVDHNKGLSWVGAAAALMG